MVYQAIIRFYKQNRIGFVLFTALVLRLGSAVFSTGYGFHDDHFITIEVAQSWIDGENMNGWLPDSDKGYSEPSGHSLTYPAVLYALLQTFEKIGITNPAAKMLWVRILHALLAVCVVYWGYLIVRRLYNESLGMMAGWVLALFWMLPMLGVRNLVEVVCIPPLFAGTALLLKDPDFRKKFFFYGGMVSGIAFSIRFQTGFYLMGMALAVWIRWGFARAFLFGAGVTISVLLLQGIVDFTVWGYPFAELKGYALYNLGHSGLYPNGPWYNYLLLLIGILIPPVSLMLLFGFGREWKRALIITLPVLFFLFFHSAFPNKQERFILPVVPFILITGLAGWQNFSASSFFWKRNKRLLNGCLIFAVSVNMLLLMLLSFSSSKKNRVDAMLYLSRYRNMQCLVVENTNHANSVIMPKFYLNKQWPLQINILSDSDLQRLELEFNSPGFCKPAHLVFLEEKNISERVSRMQKIFPGLTLEATIQPSFTDKVMHWLNPRNVNQVTYIYRTGL